MKSWKKLTALLLALCMAFSLCCVNVSATDVLAAPGATSMEEEEECNQFYCFILDEEDSVSGSTITFASGLKLAVTGAGDLKLMEDNESPTYYLQPKEGTELTFKMEFPEGATRKATINCGGEESMEFDPAAPETTYVHTVHWEYDFEYKNMVVDDGSGIEVSNVEISDVTVTLKQSEAPVFTGKVPANSGYELYSESWGDENYDQVWNSVYPDYSSDVCKMGVTYYYSCILERAKGYRFADDITVTLNGEVLPEDSYFSDYSLILLDKVASQSFNPISVSGKTLTVKKTAQTFQFNAKAEDGAKLTYSSDNKNVMVDADSGKVTVKKNWVGTAKIKVVAAATEKYNKSWKTVKVEVKKAVQPMTVKKSTFVVKKSDVKKKAKKLKISVSKAQGKVTYSGSKSKYVKVSSKGDITVKKGTPKGTYRITVKAAGNSMYAAGTKTVTVKVK